MNLVDLCIALNNDETKAFIIVQDKVIICNHTHLMKTNFLKLKESSMIEQCPLISM